MKRIISVLLAAALLLTFAACGKDNGQASGGKKTFTVTVRYEDGSSKDFTITSDKTTVGEALLEEGLIAGDPSQYGLYVTTVDGVVADYLTDKSYWAFHVNGEYSAFGVEQAAIDPNAIYEFVYTK